MGGARGEVFWKKGKGEGAVGPAGPKRGGGARGWAARPAHGGGGRLGRRGAHTGKGGGWGRSGGEREKEKGRRGGREKEKAFLFLISSISYMPNSPLHSTTNKRVHNPA